MTYQVGPLGTVRTGRRDPDRTPVQSTLNWEEHGEVHLDPRFAEGLEGLEGFTHLWIITWLGGDEPTVDRPLRQVPFLLRGTGEEKGVFATRWPKRPNPVGLHLVRLDGLTTDPPVIRFSGVDMVDGTPVIDLKPWVSHFDLPPDEETSSGWFDTVGFEVVTPADLEKRKEEQ
jgi:tRNA-Thr(GGU) m(6)t(6)A37 methyltransferase TsaA